MNVRPLFSTLPALILALCMAILPARLVAADAPVLVLTVDGAIGPAFADYVSRGISRAAAEGAQLVVLTIDTPGGLDTSMRSIIKAILAAPLPVAAYVAPGGARAASAGTYILYASHVAAMAPGTNLGAATPVQLGMPGAPKEPERQNEPQPSKTGNKERDARTGTPQGNPGDKGTAMPATQQPMTAKQVNDAAAYIRGLAQMHGRNAEWAERAVREAVSLSAEEALRLKVIDYIAPDVPGLLEELDGKRLMVLGQERTLHTANAALVHYDPDWRARLLAAITDPSVALLLLAIGMYGLLFEFMTPGMVLPGVLGGISLLLALYGLQLLPVNYAGLGLIVLGLAFMVAEIFLPSFGVLGLGGIAAFVVGAVILIDTDLPGFGVPLGWIFTVAALAGLAMLGLATVALKTRQRAVVIGAGTLPGALGEILEIGADGAWARVQGERWQVVSETPLARGERIRVLGRDGLVLKVAPLRNHAKGE